MLQVVFEKVHPDAKIPTKATKGSACWDVYSVEDATVQFGKVTVISAGLRMKIPPGFEVAVRPRSGLAFKQGITIVNAPGTIDEDYRGEIKVALSSLDSGCWFEIKKGDRIAQIALQKVYDFIDIVRVVETDTERGEGGFGSTGR